jgi:hypothetical protein
MGVGWRASAAVNPIEYLFQRIVSRHANLS